ncbi:helix-turn-helix transcriptional regulator [Streptomyces sp. NBC_00873]|uniref:helix-turn-helix domain-containing protein n=1 Tax=Streptomyces sp. NBC_00873 TaxID=2975852 RepID=UPI00386EC3E1|nr:helix-turn-helix transcriptional regulator [Streptomyces sp. NBC_00873]
MPQSAVPSLRQQRLGAELRKLREHAGLTSTAAAELLGLNQARVSSIESGRYAVSAERVRAFARSYDCGDERLVEAICAMTGGRTRGWWDDYREHLPAALVDLAELEYHAVELRVSLVIHIPALLQTVDHARALFREVAPPLLPYEVEHRLSHRIKRQGILHGDRAVRYTALIHEAALRMRFGGRDVACAQLENIISMSERDNVIVRVTRFGGGFSGTGQSIDYLSGPVPQLDTVQLDTHHGCEFLDARSQLVKYSSVLDRMEAAALTPAESRDFIQRLARQL